MGRRGRPLAGACVALAGWMAGAGVGQAGAGAAEPGSTAAGAGAAEPGSTAAGAGAHSGRLARLGYWVAWADGAVAGYGLPSLGQLPDMKLPSPIVGGAATPDGLGYWLVAANGGVYSFGDARFFGSPGARHLNRPIVGMAATPDGAGYWLVASDGGIFAYGDAAFLGSTGHIRLNKRIVGMAATPDGHGYWLVASDGGIFAFGDARFFGSAGGRRLNRPIVGMATTPDGAGYWLVASDGGTFAYGDAGFFGSAGSGRLVSPAVSMAPAPGGQGYWLAEADGTVLRFGRAPLLSRSSLPSRLAASRAAFSAPAASSAKAASSAPAFSAPAASSAKAASSAPAFSAPAAQGSRVVAIFAPADEGAGPPPATTTVPSTARPTTSTAPAVPTTAPATTTTPPQTTAPTSTTVPARTTTPTTTTTVPASVPAYSTPYPTGANGYDVSWPQCSPLGSPTARSLPASPAFAIVGVNGGTISTFNPCFSAEAAWAGPGLSVYIIVQPAPANSPVQETTGPDASCAANNSECEGYDWGWNYAEADLAFVRSSGVTPKVWWVDVETGEGWRTVASLQPVNAAIVQGALDAVRAAGDTVGIYSTWYQWGQITGSYLPGGQPPIWVPGASDLSGGPSSAVAYCERALSPGDPSKLSSTSIGFANGLPWLVQYGYGGAATSGIDPDYSCG